MAAAQADRGTGARMQPLVALVTEPLSDVGQTIAKALAAQSARIVLAGGVDEKGGLEALARTCSCIGAPAADIHATARGLDHKQTMHRVARLVLSRHGGLDVLVVLAPEVAGRRLGAGTELLRGALSKLGIASAAPAAYPARVLELAASELADDARDRREGAGAVYTRAVITVTQEGGAHTGSLSRAASHAAQALGALGYVVLSVRLPRDTPGPPAAGNSSASTAAAKAMEAGVVRAVLLPWTHNLQPGSVHEVAVSETGLVFAGVGATAKAGMEPAAAASPAGPVEAGAELSQPRAGQPFEATKPVEATQVACGMGGQHAAVSEPPHATAGPYPGAGAGPAAGAAAAAAAGAGTGPAGTSEGVALGCAPLPPLEPSLQAVLHTGGPTQRAAVPGAAVWLDDRLELCTGVIAATGQQGALGLLVRHAMPHELRLARSDTPGMVLTQGDPKNLEPSMHHGDYPEDPSGRAPEMNVHCFMPFNAETPHHVLAENFITPAPLFYVRNHLPVPLCPRPEEYRLSLGGEGLPAGGVRLSLDQLQSGRFGGIIHQVVTLQCAGNRRSEMAAVSVVEGRAPWNQGGIGNGRWTGVLLRDVLQAVGFNVDHPAWSSGHPVPQHCVMQGLDVHHETKVHYHVSIPFERVLDPSRGVMLAWAQNGEPLLPDHGAPLRVVVPGVVGSRSVKWLTSIRLAHGEAPSPWQQLDYKLMPPSFTTHEQWTPHAASMPAIQDMPVQAGILQPAAGAVVPRGVTAIWVRGYAWSGGGVPIIRVDVSGDGGASWAGADLMDPAPPDGPGHAWAWTRWQLPLKVPEEIRQQGGKWRVCVKAIDRHCNTQPAHVSSVWNFRGLACNAWHGLDLHVEGPNEAGA